MDRACNFFISYAEPDVQHAAWIASVLEHEGYHTTVQAWDFRPGNNFAVAMQRTLRSCQRVIAVLSPDYLDRPFPLAEWTAVFADDPDGAKRRLIPVLVRDCRPDGLLGPLVHIRIVGMDEVTAAAAIVDGVREGRAKPLGPIPFPGRGVPTKTATSLSSREPRWQRLSPDPRAGMI